MLRSDSIGYLNYNTVLARYYLKESHVMTWSDYSLVHLARVSGGLDGFLLHANVLRQGCLVL